MQFKGFKTLAQPIWSKNCRSGLLADVHQLPAANCQGAGKKKSVTPVVGGWVRVRKRDGVGFIFSIYLCRVLSSPHRETPKNVVKQTEKSWFWIFGRTFCKNWALNESIIRIICRVGRPVRGLSTRQVRHREPPDAFPRTHSSFILQAVPTHVSREPGHQQVVDV